jgi:AcrR family transcriptional regulator
MSEARPSRAERRRNSEQRILAAARELFTQHGYERTTIRAVGAAAEVDPALVMQYFGSKRELFGTVSKVTPGSADRDGLVEQLLDMLGMKIGGLPETSLATLRSMLTHPEAAQSVRGTLGRHIEEIGAALPGEHPRERAALIITTVLGLTLGHQLLELDALRDTSTEKISALLRPALEVLVQPSKD